MNHFTVEWDANTEQELARGWLSASDPQAVTAAQAEIDRLLARNPHQAGHHVSEGLYQISVPPLVAFYSIDDAQRTVEVSGVWYTP